MKPINRTNNTWHRMSKVIAEYWVRVFGTNTVAAAASATTHMILATLFVLAFVPMLLWALVLALVKQNEQRPAAKPTLIADRFSRERAG